MRLATICARAGSKRLPGKNTRELHGWPLWLWTVQQAVESGCFDFIAISTDDPAVGPLRRLESHIDGNFQIIRIKRPDELATDDAGKVPAIRHALVRAEELTGHTFDSIIDLDVTAPLRTLDDICGFCAKLDDIVVNDGSYATLVSVTPARRNPWFNLVAQSGINGRVYLPTLPRDGELKDYPLRSQDAPQCWDLTPTMTGWTRCQLLHGDDHVIGVRTHLYEMPPERSVDIDTQFDLEIVEFLMGRQMESVVA